MALKVKDRWCGRAALKKSGAVVLYARKGGNESIDKHQSYDGYNGVGGKGIDKMIDQLIAKHMPN
jgi:hypothetical protein